MFCICMNINQICKNNRKSRAFLAVPPFFRKCTFSIRKWLKICLIYCTSVLSLLSQPSGDFERAERKVWVGSQQLHLSCTPCKHYTHFALHLCCTQCAHLAKHLCTMCTAGISGHAHPLQLQCTLCTALVHTVHCAQRGNLVWEVWNMLHWNRWFFINVFINILDRPNEIKGVGGVPGINCTASTSLQEPLAYGRAHIIGCTFVFLKSIISLQSLPLGHAAFYWKLFCLLQ